VLAVLAAGVQQRCRRNRALASPSRPGFAAMTTTALPAGPLSQRPTVSAIQVDLRQATLCGV